MATSARRWEAAAATALYAALTLIFTWPLAAGLAHDLPGDFGDPLLNSWILAWDATHLTAGWRAWWNANIFFPHPLGLAYSEHLAAPALQILPIYWLTANPILCYNLLFLSTFVWSGLGMFLFVRELTSDNAAAFVAGLAYAFAPYRVGSLPHLQVLSSAWMPFVLFGFRRYFVTRRRGWLVAAAIAWLLQNLSCGYYLLFFAPIVGLYLAWELTTRDAWREVRTVVPVAASVVFVCGLTLPFLVPYLELRRAGFSPRSIVETQKFSADVYAYLTADPNLRVWGSIARAWPHAEGALFPGLTVTVLAFLAIVAAARATDDRSTADRSNSWTARRWVTIGGSVAALVVLLTLLAGFSIRVPGLKIASLGRALVIVGVLALAWLAVSGTLRQRVADWLRTPAGCLCLITIFAIVMSFGPRIVAQGRVVLETAPYALFYRLVPGFDGLRVPARFGMIVALGLSALAGLGLSALRTTLRMQTSAPIAAVAALLIAIESFAAPIPINQTSSDYARPGLAPLPPLTRTAPPVYEFLRTLPADSAIVELPLGEPAFDVRYMFFSTTHWRPLVNGYTGGRPAEYELLDQTLQDLFTQPERAWTVLRAARPTHAVVHEGFYASGRGALVSDWLRSRGAHEIGTFGADRVFALP
jgi:hypothetical protein